MYLHKPTLVHAGSDRVPRLQASHCLDAASRSSPLSASQGGNGGEENTQRSPSAVWYQQCWETGKSCMHNYKFRLGGQKHSYPVIVSARRLTMLFILPSANINDIKRAIPHPER